MPTGNEAVEARVRTATEAGFRGQLLARGQSRSLIWRDGQLPPDAPNFSPQLSYDLQSYGYGLLDMGLRLLDGDGDAAVARSAFEQSAEALESLVVHGPDTPDRDFHRFVAAAAYHLGRFSARAYSTLRTSIDEANLSRAERCVALLMLRDLDRAQQEILDWRREGLADDGRLVELLASDTAVGQIKETPDDDDGEDDDVTVDVVDLALTDNLLGALATAFLALERGDAGLMQEAVAGVDLGRDEAGEMNMVPQWWCHRLTAHLLRDLWDSSFHERLPISPDTLEGSEEWAELRHLFIASAFRRSRAEIELWPSQLEAVDQAINGSGNMVVSLPTSAGKTRVAELCILRALAKGQRVFFVTPLRALSAQTEVSLQKTLAPLGKTVSSLYGSIGVSETDTDFFGDRDVIVATPEKLDFALRNDPSLLDDVGLVVLDEGHMIGLGEREIRYEVQIQRLLRRDDAKDRRIVCLSAVLPDGDQLDDFCNWLTNDADDGLVRKNWRPTRLRYGEILWRGTHARLNARVGDEKPWVENYITGFIPKGRKTLFPRDQRELCLATAWRLVEDGQTALIFCPLRKSVQPFAEAIVKLHRQGGLKSVFKGDESVLSTALAIGAEWLGADHALLKCLKLGVAIHHGALPTPYRKEVERLLREGVLPVTISSPTLAQGLNLSASAVIFHGLERNRKDLTSSEFRNIVGRAGRAYVDVEGLVLCPLFDKQTSGKAKWDALLANQAGHEMESGLLRLTITLLRRMSAKIGDPKLGKLAEYALNNAAAWDFVRLPTEKAAEAEDAGTEWKRHLASLDTAILSLLSDGEVADADLAKTLDDVLSSSLFHRRVMRRKLAHHKVFQSVLLGRAKVIWANSTPLQRKGYFLSGVGFATGKALDANAERLNELLVAANGAILNKEDDAAVKAITRFAEIVFGISPFTPDNLPGNWRAILDAWLRGNALQSLAADDQETILRFVEQGLVYHLPWAMEAVRVRRIANEEKLELTEGLSDMTLADLDMGRAVAAVETGSLDVRAALLMRTGFSSRSAAIKIISDMKPDFDSTQGLRAWLRGPEVRKATRDESFPTPETHGLWLEYLQGFVRTSRARWSSETEICGVSWSGDEPDVDTPLRVIEDVDGSTIVTDAEFRTLGTIDRPLNSDRCGLVIASAVGEGEIAVEYLGPDVLWAEE
ncbi:DEAD/DEAH box helicase [Devosia insulae DS-56]|uniref:DEAD/DEAH box helicase n=1 Tax=Devosia insulae DS-56 TaxID=1116389 RepID=A0A1E5XUX6_9HYPH|nr:DEAD/DEAH box helicase [Devosia insulae]OEO32398.1 DEAD/DEAH box helicase [Devosia insulae DS-56]